MKIKDLLDELEQEMNDTKCRLRINAYILKQDIDVCNKKPLNRNIDKWIKTVRKIKEELNNV